MSAFIDTGVLVAFHSVRDARHARAIELVEELKEGGHGALYTSDYVFDEAITLTQARTGREDVVVAVGESILPADPQERWVSLLHVTPEEFSHAWALLRRQPKARLSFTDWTIVELVTSRRIDEVASFDSRLDAWVRRLS